MYDKFIEEKKKTVIRILLEEVPEKWEGHTLMREFVNQHAECAPHEYRLKEARDIADEILNELEPNFVYNKEWSAGDKLIFNDGNTYMIVFENNFETTNYKLLSLEDSKLQTGMQFLTLPEMKRRFQLFAPMGIQIVKHIAKKNAKDTSLT